MRKGLIIIGVSCLLLVLVLPGDADDKLGDESDGSRAIPVHQIELYDEEGAAIRADDEQPQPFSLRQTCGECHSVERISEGWHFNAADANIAPGRAGQPWILVDAGSGTVIPLSYRPWPGTYRPEQVGLTSWQFVKLFGRHMPGGGVGELDSVHPYERAFRQPISGKLEINCLSCHNAHPGQDQAEYAGQIARQNFRWAAAGACEFASVRGIAATQPDTYDPLTSDAIRVTYRKNTFDHKNRVFFDIVREVSAERCYFCHSNVDVDKNGSEKWTADEDVHLAAGMTCVDCHRNGLDHNITRGYEGEDIASKNPLASASSCESCHTAGRLGAAVPEHPGIPPVHFDKLSCTACHSGPWPAQRTYRTKTSRAHGLGLGTYSVNKSADALPHIVYPVFAKQQDSKIGPHKLIWPAFWGILADQNITPIALEVVRQTVGKIVAKERLPRSGDWPSLTREHIREALTSLQKGIEGKPVYISGGKLHRLDRGKLTIIFEHPAAQPYLWPIAHNVRPAAQSLGVRRCEDCHSIDAPFFFGKVDIDSPLVSQRVPLEVDDLLLTGRGRTKEMAEFQDVDAFYIKVFNFSFVFRPWLKVVALGSCAVLAGVLLLYALKALACIAAILVGKDS